MWIRVPVCLELISPVHIGFLPNGAGTVVAPTRLYVPGKNLWAALTASLAERMFDSPRPQDFAAVGDDLRDSAAFSYFYLSDGERIFTPSYGGGELNWGNLQGSDVRATFLDSRVSTQIGENGAAQEGSLHEIEFIRHHIGSPMTGATTSLLCGVIWMLQGRTVAAAPLQMEDELPLLYLGKSKLPLLAGFTLGGERNYGFGRVHRMPISQALARQLEELWPNEPSVPFLLKGPLLGHSRFAPDIPFKGSVEIVASREYPQAGGKSYESPGSSISSSGYFFAPGTVIGGGPIEGSFDSFGRIVIDAAGTPVAKSL
jgi:hypothetical protein